MNYKILYVVAGGIILYGLYEATKKPVTPPPSQTIPTPTTAQQVTTAPTPAPTSSNQAFVTLTVIDANTMAPLSNVAVSAAETAYGANKYNTVYTDSSGHATLPVNPGCLPSQPGVGVFVYICLHNYQPRSFAIPCLQPKQTYSLGTIPLSR